VQISEVPLERGLGRAGLGGGGAVGWWTVYTASGILPQRGPNNQRRRNSEQCRPVVEGSARYDFPA
jgi:hypothetical protein